jgi:type III restriction enzyme
VCKGGTYPAQLMYQELADMACERITAAITRAEIGNRPVKAVLDPYNPVGSTAHVNFNTSKTSRWQTDARSAATSTGSSSTATGKPSFAGCWKPIRGPCLRQEPQPGAGGALPHTAPRCAATCRTSSCSTRRLVPTTAAKPDDDLLHLVVEIKGYRGEDAKDKKNTMETYWVPGVNNHGNYGRWAFAEMTDVWEMQADFETKVKEHFNQMIDGVIAEPVE